MNTSRLLSIFIFQDTLAINHTSEPSFDNDKCHNPALKNQPFLAGLPENPYKTKLQSYSSQMNTGWSSSCSTGFKNTARMTTILTVSRTYIIHLLTATCKIYLAL